MILYNMISKKYKSLKICSKIKAAATNIVADADRCFKPP